MYIFVRSLSGWSKYTKLTLQSNTANAFFGNDVSIYDSTLIVSAIGDNQLTGAVYNFAYNGARWSQTQKIVPSDGEKMDYFGSSCALWGNNLVVGANGAAG